MTPIETNKPVFFDIDGEPLEGGQIYIGQPSTDPRTNAKTVTFRDAGGATFTAQQPLNTIAGRIVYNGKPIAALVDGEYSMLIINSSGVQVEYDPSVNSEAAPELDLSETIRVGLTLADIKAFDVSVGDVVRNVGGTIVSDGGGVDWYVVSNTGSGGNDVDLIDFANGLQGRRYHVYPPYQEESVTLDGDFSGSPSLKFARIGSLVSASGVEAFFSHASSSNPKTSAGVVPTWARPASGEVSNSYWYFATQDANYSAYILADGTFGLRYFDTTTGTAVASTTSGIRPSISYTV